MTLTRKKELGRGSKPLTAKSELKPVSAKRAAKLADAGTWNPFSTFGPSSTVGLSRATALKAKPKAEKPAREQLPFPLRPDREPPAPRLAVPKPVKRPKDTGPSKAVREWVWERFGRVCVVPGCGREATQLHHRLNRKMGGDKRPFINHRSNVVPMDAFCNAEVEQFRKVYTALGFYLEEGSLPYLRPAHFHGLGWMTWDLDADDWVSVFDTNDWYTADRAGVTV